MNRVIFVLTFFFFYSDDDIINLLVIIIDDAVWQVSTMNLAWAVHIVRMIGLYHRHHLITLSCTQPFAGELLCVIGYLPCSDRWLGIPGKSKMWTSHP